MYFSFMVEPTKHLHKLERSYDIGSLQSIQLSPEVRKRCRHPSGVLYVRLYPTSYYLDKEKEYRKKLLQQEELKVSLIKKSLMEQEDMKLRSELDQLLRNIQLLQNNLQNVSYVRLEVFQQWLAFGKEKKQLKLCSLFEILRATPIITQDQTLDEWTQLREIVARQRLEECAQRLNWYGPKFYYYLINRLTDITQFHPYIPSFEELQYLELYVQALDKGFRFRLERLYWQFQQPEITQYDSLDEFYTQRCDWDDYQVQKFVQDRLLMARYASVIHIWVSRGLTVSELKKASYSYMCYLIKLLLDKNDLKQIPPFYKGLVYYKDVLGHPYFHTKVYVNEEICGEKMIGENGQHLQYDKLLSQLPPDFEKMIDSITQINHIQFEQMQEYSQYLPNLQEFEQKIYYHKTRRFCWVLGVKLTQLRIQKALEYVSDQSQFGSEQKQVFKKKIKRMAPASQFVPAGKDKIHYLSQCKCGAVIENFRIKNHKCPPPLTIPPVVNPKVSFSGFIQCYRISDNRRRGLCLHCNKIMGMDINIKEQHPYQRENSSHNLKNYPYVGNVCYIQPLGNVAKVEVNVEGYADIKQMPQQYIQTPLHCSLPQIYPDYEFNSEKIRLVMSNKSVYALHTIHKDQVFGPVGGSIVPNQIAMLLEPTQFRVIKLSEDFSYCVISQYSLSALVTMEGNDCSPNVELILAAYDSKLFGFWRVIKTIQSGENIVAKKGWNIKRNKESEHIVEKVGKKIKKAKK